MDPSQKTMFIIKITRTLRMLGNGILIIVFIQSLYQKEMYEPFMYMVQAALYLGTAITSYLIKINQYKIGTKNALLLSTLMTALTSILFSESKKLSSLFIIAFIGMMPVVGQELQIFQSIQQSILSKMIATQSKSNEELVEIKQKQFRSYKLIGRLSQLLSCVIVTYILSNTMKSVQTSYSIILYMFRVYTILASLQFFIYLSFDKEQIQLAPTYDHTQNGKAIAQCVRPGSLMLITFLVFFCTSILNMTNFLYFLHQKYEMQISEVAPIIILLIFINHLVGYLTKKLVELKCSKIWLLLGLPFNLMVVFVAITQRLGKWQSVTIVANLISNSFILNVWQQLKYSLISEQQLQRYQNKIDFCKHIGTVFSIIVYAIFSIFGGTSIQYSISLMISGGVKFFLSLALVSCLTCLGNYSFNSKQNKGQISIYDRNFHQIKNYPEQHQNLHLPNTH